MPIFRPRKKNCKNFKPHLFEQGFDLVGFIMSMIFLPKTPDLGK